MRAVVVQEQGGPEVLQIVELPEPSPGPGEVRVDVRAAGVNFLDIQQRSGVYRMPTPFPAGNEGAGTVSAVGTDVRGVAAGGTGLLLTQLVTAAGGRLIGTASTPEKADLALAAGADVVAAVRLPRPRRPGP